MFYEGAPTVMQPGMVFFLHMILMDSESGSAMTLGRTSLVTETGAEVLSRMPLEMVVGCGHSQTSHSAPNTADFTQSRLRTRCG